MRSSGPHDFGCIITYSPAGSWISSLICCYYPYFHAFLSYGQSLIALSRVQSGTGHRPDWNQFSWIHGWKSWDMDLALNKRFFFFFEVKERENWRFYQSGFDHLCYQYRSRKNDGHFKFRHSFKPYLNNLCIRGSIFLTHILDSFVVILNSQ